MVSESREENVSTICEYSRGRVRSEGDALMSPARHFFVSMPPIICAVRCPNNFGASRLVLFTCQFQLEDFGKNGWFQRPLLAPGDLRLMGNKNLRTRPGRRPERAFITSEITLSSSETPSDDYQNWIELNLHKKHTKLSCGSHQIGRTYHVQALALA